MPVDLQEPEIIKRRDSDVAPTSPRFDIMGYMTSAAADIFNSEPEMRKNCLKHHLLSSKNSKQDWNKS